MIPSYNQAAFIERSLLSVFNQGYANTELIVIDGGSSDGTVAILDQYKEYISVVVKEPDRGQSDALNKGFSLATGEIVGWLNSDDLYCPGTLRHVARLFASRPDISVVYGDWYTIDREDMILREYFALPYSRLQLITEGFLGSPQAMFWRRRLHECFGEFDLRFHYTMDYDFMLRLARLTDKRDYLRTNRPLACFRVHEGQKTGSSARGFDEHLLIVQEAGLTWKYDWHGRALRILYRFKRVAYFLIRGGPGYVFAIYRSRDRRPFRGVG